MACAHSNYRWELYTIYNIIPLTYYLPSNYQPKVYNTSITIFSDYEFRTSWPLH